jgi:hypothetical protein
VLHREGRHRAGVGGFYFEEEFGRRSADVRFEATAVIGCVSSDANDPLRRNILLGAYRLHVVIYLRARRKQPDAGFTPLIWINVPLANFVFLFY